MSKQKYKKDSTVIYMGERYKILACYKIGTKYEYKLEGVLLNIKEKDLII